VNPRRSDGGDEERREVEVRARTVDEAVARGLVRLGGLSRSEVLIEVLSEGKGGLLGFGAEEALVRLTTLLPGEEPRVTTTAIEAPSGGKAPTAAAEAPLIDVDAAADEAVAKDDEDDARETATEAALPGEGAAAKAAADATAQRPRRGDLSDGEVEAQVKDLVVDLLGKLGCTAVEVAREGTLLPVEIDDEESVVFCIRGKGAERLLHDDAEPLLALQFLTRLATTRMTNTWTNLLLDVNDDRKRRVKELFHLAEQSADLVEREGRPVSLPPMTPYERRVIHLALRDHETVATQSIGSGDSRKVTVRLKGQLLPGV